MNLAQRFCKRGSEATVLNDTKRGSGKEEENKSSFNVNKEMILAKNKGKEARCIQAVKTMAGFFRTMAVNCNAIPSRTNTKERCRPGEAKKLCSEVHSTSKMITSHINNLSIGRNPTRPTNITKRVISSTNDYYKLPKRMYFTGKLKPALIMQKNSILHKKSSCNGNKPKLEDFTIVSTLGIGYFGEVKLAKWKTYLNQPCAIKIVSKENAIKLKQAEHLLTEREMLLSLNHPFIMKW